MRGAGSTPISFNTVNGKHCCNPTEKPIFAIRSNDGFNTVNGKHCCNEYKELKVNKVENVSIP